jgi:hypothetical protein
VWVVTFRDIHIERKDSDESERGRNYSVYLESGSERLLKIMSDTIQVEWEYAGAASAAEREDKYRKTGLSRMMLPEEVPVPFRVVLEKCIFQTHSAAEMEAIYVSKEFDTREEPVRTWQLTLRGIPPQPFFGLGAENIPAKERTSVTLFADPELGETMGTVVPAW